MYSCSKRSRLKREGGAGHNILHNFGNLFSSAHMGLLLLVQTVDVMKVAVWRLKTISYSLFLTLDTWSMKWASLLRLLVSEHHKIFCCSPLQFVSLQHCLTVWNANCLNHTLVYTRPQYKLEEDEKFVLQHPSLLPPKKKHFLQTAKKCDIHDHSHGLYPLWEPWRFKLKLG